VFASFDFISGLQDIEKIAFNSLIFTPKTNSFFVVNKKKEKKQ